jgi:hypothetical protein
MLTRRYLYAVLNCKSADDARRLRGCSAERGLGLLLGGPSC